MLTIIKNNWNREMRLKGSLILTTVLIVLSVVAAIVLTNNVQIKENIAVVGACEKQITSPYLSVTYCKTQPKDSELVKGKYDAVVLMDHGKISEMKCVKNEETKEKIKNSIDHLEKNAVFEEGSRKIGTNIIGYMMMFLFMQGVVYGRMFGEEKEKHMAERVSISPIAFWKYMIGHALFIDAMIFIPSFAVIVVADLLGVSIGFSVIQYVILLGILTFMATAFSLFINSFFHVTDTANMIGSAAVILTTIMSGSFYSVLKSGSVLDKVIHLLPQKDMLSFMDDLEDHVLTKNSYLEMSYAILLAVVFLAVAIYKTRHDYVCCGK